MKTIIHDLKESEIKKIKFNDDIKIIDANLCLKSCIGCFSCWVKHPKNCALKDSYSSIVDSISKSDELILISQNRYGCYSYKVKRVLERCIGYVLPYFTIRNNEIHHESRYDKKLKLTLYTYGNITKEDKTCLEKLLQANAINLNAENYECKIYKNTKELVKCIH